MRVRLQVGAALFCLALAPVLVVPGDAAGAGGRLAETVSSYLRLHATDPVAWQPWGEMALEQARREEKLIFLVVGHAACRRCAELERETFADPEVVAELNTRFIPILVDRDMRPDLDVYWSKVAKALNGTTDWPQVFVLTPELLPVFVGNDLPPRPRDGRIGLLDLLRTLAKTWQEERPGLLAQGEEGRRSLPVPATVQLPRKEGKPGEPTNETERDGRERAAGRVLAEINLETGTFSSELEFPRVTGLSLLLREGVRLQQKPWLAGVRKVLDHLAAGGVRDLLGGAFRHGSLDREGNLPRCELLLADNVLLARLYLEGYQATGEGRYAGVARSILDDLLARFRLPEGGLATALIVTGPGPSEGPAGETCDTWTPALIRAELVDAADTFLQVIAPVPGRQDGGGALRLLVAPTEMESIQARFRGELQRLAGARAHRAPPRRDVQLLTSWNALAAGVYALAARVLDDPRYHAVARELLTPILEQYNQHGRIPHVRVGDTWGSETFLDDTAFVVQALLEFYETDFRFDHLTLAWKMSREMLQRFTVGNGGMLRLTPVGDKQEMLPDQVVVADWQGLPSGNAAAWEALARLNLWRRDPELTARLAEMTASLPSWLGAEGHRGGDVLRLLDFAPATVREVIVVGDPQDTRVKSMLMPIRQCLNLGEVVAVVTPGAMPDAQAWPGLSGREMVAEVPTIYVCAQGLCQIKTFDKFAWGSREQGCDIRK
ncbi:MAG: thioredoxin domain-containing protein [Magnetococcales bacterium]|nr:thioredoxin domain-containing protein [Magnetococcales bacterium]